MKALVALFAVLVLGGIGRREIARSAQDLQSMGQCLRQVAQTDIAAEQVFRCLR